MEKRNWVPVEGFDFKEILFEEYDGIAKITINRPRYRNAFTPAPRGRCRRHSLGVVRHSASALSSLPELATRLSAREATCM